MLDAKKSHFNAETLSIGMNTGRLTHPTMSYGDSSELTRLDLMSLVDIGWEIKITDDASQNSDQLIVTYEEGEVVLRVPTRSATTYEVLGSTDLVDWKRVLLLDGNGSVFNVAFPGRSAGNFWKLKALQ